MRTDVLAAVDLGTNSTHLVVAKVDGVTIEVVEREREMTRLGSSSSGLTHLSPDAIDRAVVALDRFRRVAEIHDAPVRVTATSAVREADNRDELIHRARVEAGVEVEVISGFEEARLIHLGVLQAVPVFDRQMLLCDIGGGSTELVSGRSGEVTSARSFRLGAIRLTEQFFRGSADVVVTPEDIEQCRRYIRATLAPHLTHLRNQGVGVLVGSSGTIGALCSMVTVHREELTGEPRPRSLKNLTVTSGELDDVVARIIAAGTTEQRAGLPGLDPRRADIILAGALLAQQVMRGLDATSLTFSDYALREGVLLDTWQRRNGGGLEQLAELRRRNVAKLVDAMDEDPAHAMEVARLAGLLFAETAGWHGVDGDSRELLEAGAALCNVGLFISHSAHHKHSYYIVRNSEHLTGFTDAEVEVIAQIARYHRRAVPKRKHDAFAALHPDDQQKVRVLAGIVRLAVGLDRNRAGRVSTVRCHEDDDGSLVVGVIPVDGADISLELISAGERTELLSQALDLPVRVEQLVLAETGDGADPDRG